MIYKLLIVYVFWNFWLWTLNIYIWWLTLIDIPNQYHLSHHDGCVMSLQLLSAAGAGGGAGWCIALILRHCKRHLTKINRFIIMFIIATVLHQYHHSSSQSSRHHAHSKMTHILSSSSSRRHWPNSHILINTKNSTRMHSNYHSSSL